MNILKGRRVFFGQRARFLYEVMGLRFRQKDDWQFMNYGFALNQDLRPLPLANRDLPERYGAQLYQATIGDVDLAGKRVLDVGSGRGGGASVVQRYYGPKETVGLDQAVSAVRFCNRLYRDVRNLSFVQGNAMAMPFEDNSFDVILNIESLHCYPDPTAFIAEVLRVLKPGGMFLCTDFCDRDAADGGLFPTEDFAANTTLDITQNVIDGLDRDNDRRLMHISKHAPVFFKRLLTLWAGVPGSWIYDDFVNGRRRYLIQRAQK